MSKTIGLDLGTTNSVAAHLDEDGDPQVIKNNGGEKKTRSVVQFREDKEEVVVGHPAVNALGRYPEDTVVAIKREMGDDEWEREFMGESFRPEQISARIIDEIVTDAEKQVGDVTINEAVITVPAYFGQEERAATKNAGQIAGLEVKRLLTEPTAACLRYGIQDEYETVLVYDLGGGTFDATLVNIDQDESIEVVGTDGDQRLGGEDFDQKVYETMILPEFRNETGKDPEKNKRLKSTLLEQAKLAKENLSNSETSFVTTPEFEMEISREEFNDATEHLVEDTIDTIDRLFEHENVDSSKDDVDRVLLAGGSTRIPLVHKRLEEYFGFQPSHELDQDMVVAEGAAIATEQPETDLDRDTKKSIAPEATDDGEDTMYEQVIPKTLSVEVVEQYDHQTGEVKQKGVAPIIEKNEPVPAKNEVDGFTTIEDNQTQILVRILEGESAFPDDNKELGNFRLSGIKPQPAREPNIKVFFEVDRDGLIHAEAKDIETGEKADITVEIGLEQEDVESMKKVHQNLPTK